MPCHTDNLGTARSLWGAASQCHMHLVFRCVSQSLRFSPSHPSKSSKERSPEDKEKWAAWDIHHGWSLRPPASSGSQITPLCRYAQGRSAYRSFISPGFSQGLGTKIKGVPPPWKKLTLLHDIRLFSSVINDGVLRG